MLLLDYLASAMSDWGYWSYLFVFLVAMVESLVVTGVFIPGTFIILFLGFLAAQNDAPLIPLLTFVILGGIAGDVLSFMLGEKKGGWVLNLTHKIFKRNYLEIGREFFERHGDKSVFIGRFIAIVRPFIPFIAGVFKMDIRKFLFWNISSAAVWGSLYILLGYFSGAAWRTVLHWSGRAGLALLVIALIGAGAYFVKRHLKKEGIGG